MALEAHVIVLIAPLIEGSSESEETLLAKVLEKIETIEKLKDVREHLKPTEDLLKSCFSKTDNLPVKLWKALVEMTDVDVGTFPR